MQRKHNLPRPKNNPRTLLLLAAAATILLARLAPTINLNPVFPPIEYENCYEKDGVYDLRDTKFDKKCAVIQYSALYYPNQYLLPDRIGGAAPSVYDDETGMPADYITQRFTLLMPETRTYRIQTFAPSVRLYVNGKLYAQNGDPGTTWRNTQTAERNLSVYATPVDGKIEIVAHTAVFNFYDDRATRLAFWVTLPETQYNFAWDESRYVYLIIGTLLGSSVLLLLMFFARRNMTQYLWFSLACLAIGLRYGGIGQYDELSRLFPFVSGNLSFVFERMGFPLATAFLMLYLHKVFPKVFDGWFKHAVVGLSLLYALLVATIDPRIHTWLLQYYQWVLHASTVWILVRLIRYLRKPTPEQSVALYGILVYLAGTIYDFLRYNNFDNLWGLPKINATETAMVVCYFAQMLSLFIGNNRAVDSAKEAERLAAEEARQLEKIDQIKTEFLANISHELKTPLTVISGTAQESEKNAKGDPETMRSMRLIASEADRLGLLVSQVLDVTRIDENRMRLEIRPCSLAGMIQDTLSAYYPVFSKNNNRLTIARSPADPIALCDSARVSQVLVNLISNAARHTRDGSIEVSFAETEAFAQVTVSDTGDGISPEGMSRLFERYQTADNATAPSREAGTGLGLYISKHIVEAHGGSIEVESKPGEGTAVRFTLPLLKSSLSESGTSSPA